MTFNDITQCIHFAISTKFGIASIIIEEDNATTCMGSPIAPIHPQASESLEQIPNRICELLTDALETHNITAEQLTTKTAIVRWGKVRYPDSENIRVTYVAGVDLIKGGAL